MTKLSPIIEAINERDRQFRKTSIELINSIPHVLNGIMEFLDVSEDISRWDTIELQDGYVMIHMRVLRLHALSANKYTIGIPFDLAEDGTIHDVVEFLLNHSETDTHDPSANAEAELRHYEADDTQLEEASAVTEFIEMSYMYRSDGKRNLN